MSAPRIFRGREKEVTMEELATLGAAVKAKSTNECSENEDIPLIKSDIIASPAVGTRPVVAETKKRKVGRPPKASRAAKRLKWAVNSETAIESSQSAAPSAEDLSSSPYATPESPSITVRKVPKVSNQSRVVPGQQVTPVAQIHSSARGLTQCGTGANVRECDDDVKENAMPEPASVHRGRGRPRKAQSPVPLNTTGTDSVRTTRATTRNASKKATPVKAPQARAAPKATAAKNASTTHGRGVGRLKKTPCKSKSKTLQFTEEEYAVEKIVDSRIDPVTQEQMYMVKWKGYGVKDSTWEPAKNLGKCSSLIQTFANSQKSKGKGKK